MSDRILADIMAAEISIMAITTPSVNPMVAAPMTCFTLVIMGM
jgi:hypothetical protein